MARLLRPETKAAGWHPRGMSCGDVAMTTRRSRVDSQRVTTPHSPTHPRSEGGRLQLKPRGCESDSPGGVFPPICLKFGTRGGRPDASGRGNVPLALGARGSMPRFSVSRGHVSGSTDMETCSARSPSPSRRTPEACPPCLCVEELTLQRWEGRVLHPGCPSPFGRQPRPRKHQPGLRG